MSLLGLANEIYSVSFNTDTVIGSQEEQLHKFIEQMNIINEAHHIKSYKIKVNRLVDSYSRSRR